MRCDEATSLILSISCFVKSSVGQATHSSFEGKKYHFPFDVICWLASINVGIDELYRSGSAGAGPDITRTREPSTNVCQRRVSARCCLHIPVAQRTNTTVSDFMPKVAPFDLF